MNPELAEGNAIIEGENLEVLKCLLAAYRNRIKCIYIDPPYNKDKDFVYSDVWKVDKRDLLGTHRCDLRGCEGRHEHEE